VNSHFESKQEYMLKQLKSYIDKDHRYFLGNENAGYFVAALLHRPETQDLALTIMENTLNASRKNPSKNMTGFPRPEAVFMVFCQEIARLAQNGKLDKETTKRVLDVAHSFLRVVRENGFKGGRDGFELENVEREIESLRSKFH
jgi:hypothetical protein